MTTFTQLVNAAKEKGFRFEADTYVFNRWGEQVTPKTRVSIMIKDCVWYTWELYTYWNDDLTKREFNENEMMMFCERYNQNNGASQRTWRKEYEALKKLGIN